MHHAHEARSTQPHRRHSGIDPGVHGVFSNLRNSDPIAKSSAAATAFLSTADIDCPTWACTALPGGAAATRTPDTSTGWPDERV